MAKKKVTTKRMLDKKVSKPDEKIDPAKAHVVVETIEGLTSAFKRIEVVEKASDGRFYFRVYVKQLLVPELSSRSYTKKQVEEAKNTFIVNGIIEAFVKPKGKK